MVKSVIFSDRGIATLPHTMRGRQVPALFIAHGSHRPMPVQSQSGAQPSTKSCFETQRLPTASGKQAMPLTGNVVSIGLPASSGNPAPDQVQKDVPKGRDLAISSSAEHNPAVWMPSSAAMAAPAHDKQPGGIPHIHSVSAKATSSSNTDAAAKFPARFRHRNAAGRMHAERCRLSAVIWLLQQTFAPISTCPLATLRTALWPTIRINAISSDAAQNYVQRKAKNAYRQYSTKWKAAVAGIRRTAMPCCSSSSSTRMSSMLMFQRHDHAAISAIFRIQYQAKSTAGEPHRALTSTFRTAQQLEPGYFPVLFCSSGTTTSDAVTYGNTSTQCSPRRNAVQRSSTAIHQAKEPVGVHALRWPTEKSGQDKDNKVLYKS